MTDSNLGNVITEPRIRRAIYATYTIVAFVAAAVTVGLAANGALPQWDITLNTVLAFVGGAVGTLATANTKTARQRALFAEPEHPGVGEDPAGDTPGDESPSESKWPLGSG